MDEYNGAVGAIFRTAGLRPDPYQSTSPVSFRRIFAACHIEYRELQLHRCTDGMYVRIPGAHYIVINSSLSYARRRFAAAHQFAHFFFGHPSCDDAAETEANGLAEALLMPRDLVYPVHHGLPSLQSLAYWFRVSPVNMAIRLEQLNLPVTG